MNKEFLFISLIGLFSIAIVILQSCKKDNNNQAPTCTITNPQDGQVVDKGEDIIISVDAYDTDGSISEVRFFVNNTKLGSVTNSPYNYTWNTNDNNPGDIVIKATAIDDTEKVALMKYQFC